MQAPVLAIEMVGLSKQFGRHRAVDAIYLVVPMAVAAFLFRRRDMLGVG